MRAKSMNVDQLLMRGFKSLNPRKAQSTYIRSTSQDLEDGDTQAHSLKPLSPVPDLVEQL